MTFRKTRGYVRGISYRCIIVCARCEQMGGGGGGGEISKHSNIVGLPKLPRYGVRAVLGFEGGMFLLLEP